MVNPEILDYVKKELAKGVSEAKLRHALMEYGWPEFEINEAFEKAKEAEPEKPAEEIPKEVIPAEKPELKEEPRPEEKPKEKPPVMKDVKKIITNKAFIIAAVLIILGSVAFFVLPSVLEEKVEVEEGGAMAYARERCDQYCKSNLCGLFNNPEFTHPELEGKTCKELGISCLLPSGEPKCETEY